MMTFLSIALAAAGEPTWTSFESDAKEPAARSGHTLTYDAIRDRTVLFAGKDSRGAYRNDIWEWDGAGQSWEHRVAANPPEPRIGHVMAHHVALDEMIMMGGWRSEVQAVVLGRYVPLGVLADNHTWRWENFVDEDGGVSSRWTDLTALGPEYGPPARAGHGMAYDPERKVLVLFGGSLTAEDEARQYETWEWGSDPVTGKGRWFLALAPTDGGEGGLFPWPRRGHAMSWFAPPNGAGSMILFGGYSVEQEAHLSDTWSWDGLRWKELQTSINPPVRKDAGLVFDSQRHRLMLLGGSADAIRDDVWQWNGTAWSAEPQPDLRPAARDQSPAIFDPLRGKTLRFGGNAVCGLLHDTWEYAGTERTWSEASPAGSAPYPITAPLQPVIAEDGMRGTALLFGGNRCNDHWEWDPGARQWTRRAEITERPPARWQHAMAYDEAGGRIVLFGGLSEVAALGDTWIWDGTRWLPFQLPVQGSAPAARSGHAMAYDPRRSAIILFGGSGNQRLDDTWEWTGAWQEVTVEGPRPDARRNHALSFDGRFVALFGGSTSARSCAPDTNLCALDTWVLDGARWHKVLPHGMEPTGRHGHTMAYDPASDVAILVGGCDDSWCPMSVPPLDDTWEWNGWVQEWRRIRSAKNPPHALEATMTYSGAAGEMVFFDPSGLAAWSFSRNGNKRPLLAPVPPIVVSEGDAATFELFATDKDGELLQYGCEGLPAGAAFHAATRHFLWNTGCYDAGDYTVACRVTDGYDAAATSVSITVQERNCPPMLEGVRDRTGIEGEPLRFVVSARDPDGEAVDLSAAKIPEHATFDPATGLFLWVPRAGQAGAHDARFRAADSQGSNEGEATLTIRARSGTSSGAGHDGMGSGDGDPGDVGDRGGPGSNGEQIGVGGGDTQSGAAPAGGCGCNGAGAGGLGGLALVLALRSRSRRSHSIWALCACLSVALTSAACSSSIANGPSRLAVGDAPALILEVLEPTGTPPVVLQGTEALLRAIANRSGQVALEISTTGIPPIELPAVAIDSEEPAEIRVDWANLPPGRVTIRGRLDGSGEPVLSNIVELEVGPPADVDGDGFFERDDCDDADWTRYPGAAELCDGADDDCDGVVDEACERCTSGDVEPCYPPGADHPSRRLGACRDGLRTCLEGGEWSECAGHRSPREESCATPAADVDCDGLTACEEPACAGFACQTLAGDPGTCGSQGCQVEVVTAAEDCERPDDEDGDGDFDCDDSDCLQKGYAWDGDLCTPPPPGIRLAVGKAHSCAIYVDDTLRCWGSNASGQLGIGAGTWSLSPALVDDGARWRLLSAGESHTCAIQSDGTLWCWGNNAMGQLGDGTTDEKRVPGPVGTDADWDEVAAGSAHTCGVRAGALWCWGGNDHGQVGDGTTEPKSTPVPMGSRNDWERVAAGASHTCALRAGTLWCWGRNDEGQLGDGTTVQTNVPVRVGTEGDWGEVSAGASHTCGLRRETPVAALWCWGRNRDGQVGDGTAVQQTKPVRAGSDSDWVAVAAGGRHTCGLRQGTPAMGATLWCWGDNLYRQLGDETTARVLTPSLARNGNGWTTAAAGPRHTCAAVAGGIYCWGDDYYGQTGDATTGNSIQWDEVAPGGYHTCGLQAGSLWCWGSDSYGALGNGSATGPRTVPAQVGDKSDWVEIAAGERHTCGVRAGALFCWGHNLYGQIGNGATVDRADPVSVGNESGWGELAAGVSHTCGVRGRRLWCWGDNRYGQLGDGRVGASHGSTHVSNRLRPYAVGCGTDPAYEASWTNGSEAPCSAAPADWSRPTAGQYHTCALRAGTPWCWGLNDQGQLGDGTAMQKTAPSEPVKIAGEAKTDWETLASRGSHTCGMRAEPMGGGAIGTTLWCWGLNNEGQLGDGTTVRSTTPVRVGTEIDWSRLTVGYSHTCGLRGGALWCWGNNESLQLGDGHTLPGLKGVDKASPTRTGTESDWVGVAAGNSHACALRAGRPWCWGSNSDGQLGDGTVGGKQTTPARVQNENDWARVTTAGGRTCGLRAGTAWCWGTVPVRVGSESDWKSLVTGGANRCGLKGGSLDGSVTGSTLWCWGNSVSEPTQIGSGSDWHEVAAALSHACGVRAGKLWCWGANGYGQLGDGTTANKAEPVLVGNESDWVGLAAGGGNRHTCALRGGLPGEPAIGASLWCWGYNVYGQVGDGSAVNKTVPSRVGSESGWTHAATGDSHTCGVRAGTLWCWGYNFFAQLGDGTTANRSLPARVGSESDWDGVAAGFAHTCGLRAGTVRCWGFNQSGQLGDGTTAEIGCSGFPCRREPVRVGSEHDWENLVAGGHQTCALRAGTLWCWGNNDSGQLGLGGPRRVKR